MQIDSLFPSHSKVLIVSHDAGGAEILSSLAKVADCNFLFSIQGPALNIFERKLGAVNRVTLEEGIEAADFILCGSSWQSDLEFEAIKLGKERKIKTYCFLDHWVNYPQRFVRKDLKVTPDMLLVGDEMALRIAEESFPGQVIHQIENPYVLEIKNQLKKRIADSGFSNNGNFLYVCEPVRDHALLRYGNERHWGYIEEEALRFFLDNIHIFGVPAKSIILRPHPSEVNTKYDWALKEYDLPIQIGGQQPLIEEVIQSEFVIGCQSMALVIGLLADKKVISCIPPGGQECALPHSNILKLKDMIRTQRT